MLRRKIQSKIADYLENGSNKILVLNGARQIGKSYIIRHEGQKRFANYIEIDLIEDKKGDRVFEGTYKVTIPSRCTTASSQSTTISY